MLSLLWHCKILISEGQVVDSSCDSSPVDVVNQYGNVETATFSSKLNLPSALSSVTVNLQNPDHSAFNDLSMVYSEDFMDSKYGFQFSHEQSHCGSSTVPESNKDDGHALGSKVDNNSTPRMTTGTKHKSAFNVNMNSNQFDEAVPSISSASCAVAKPNQLVSPNCKKLLVRNLNERQKKHNYKARTQAKHFSDVISNVSGANRRSQSRKVVYVCQWCKKAFSNFNSLQVHERTHTGEKPFKCEVCQKCFTQGGTLTIHMRIHTGERPYKCDRCSKSFPRATFLNKHKLLHNDLE